MNNISVYGGCIFSQSPKLYGEHIGELFADGKPFKERLNNIIRWTKGYKDRLFPVLWIHPDEENIVNKIDEAKRCNWVE